MDYVSNQNPTAILYAVDQLSAKGKFSEVLENIEVPSAEEISKMASVAFASPVTREYPIFNKHVAFLSAADYLGSGKEDKSIEESIKRACHNFGINSVFEELEDIFEVAMTVKSASNSEPMVKYAFSLELEDGNVKGYYPINTAYEVEESARAFQMELNKVPQDIASEIAQEIVKAASALDIMSFIPGEVVSLGTIRLVNESSAEKQVKLRETYITDEIAELYRDVIKSAASGEDILELVSTMEQMDKIFLPENAFQENIFLKSAFDTLNSGVSVKSLEDAASKTVLFEAEDLLVPVEALTKVASMDISPYFTKETAEVVKDLTKLASECNVSASLGFNSLDKDIRTQFIKLLLTANL